MKVFVSYNTVCIVTDEDLRGCLTFNLFYCYVFAQELPSHTFAVAMSLYQIKLWNTTTERPSQDVLAEKAFIRPLQITF